MNERHLKKAEEQTIYDLRKNYFIYPTQIQARIDNGFSTSNPKKASTIYKSNMARDILQGFLTSDKQPWAFENC